MVAALRPLSLPSPRLGARDLSSRICSWIFADLDLIAGLLLADLAVDLCVGNCDASTAALSSLPRIGGERLLLVNLDL